MLKLDYIKHDCIFIRPGGTSRGVLKTKPSWIIKVSDLETGRFGLGEASIIPKLNPESETDVVNTLQWLKNHINQPAGYLDEYLINIPSVRFGIESALLDLKNGGNQIYFESDFIDKEKPIVINGLIWMNDFETMKSELENKVEQGFKCIKIKVGAIDLAEELKLVAFARSLSDSLVIRLDANGAFLPEFALNTLKTFAEFNIHSIEQPIKAGQILEMEKLCRVSPIPIALDEELIGINEPQAKQELIQKIKPQYIILKPSLLGGIASSEEWIKEAEKIGVGWWLTSALESNIGLNIIAQWAGKKNHHMPQGLGTGKLFSNNFEGPLHLIGEELYYNPKCPINSPL
ncbi:o-succinylbenzoate synthase [Luteibaculum oceani]|uniref:O-succinylbenzoate synthase n=1 Tax=Luteibaculum oceani TaxID=1294296 RepID=A0A5C6V855_9FLAO|nr:o-succinylbenzoate synthase [Luteibaculum oceani]TXC81512.1 o-succinylbenzoate synthase [Luteibaculum oceani]